MVIGLAPKISPTCMESAWTRCVNAPNRRSTASTCDIEKSYLSTNEYRQNDKQMNRPHFLCWRGWRRSAERSCNRREPAPPVQKLRDGEDMAVPTGTISNENRPA